MRTDELPIYRNPFHVLGVFTRDSRQRIVEAAEQRSLTHDAEVCAKARGDLTNPRSRLAAELAWLPGLSPRRSQQLVEGLGRDPASVFKTDNLPALARANLMASAFMTLDPKLGEAEWVACIIALSRAIEDVSAASVLADINEDRLVAGFTEVKSVEAVEEGLRERRREIGACVRGAFDLLPQQKLARIAAAAAETATRGGTTHPPAFIDDMIEAYAVGVHAFLTKEADEIRQLIDKARDAAPSGAAAVEPYLERIESHVGGWYAAAKPIQLLAGAKGTSHDLSQDIAGAVRGLGVFLYNNHSMLELSQRIVRLMKESFGNLPEIAERVDEDARTLDGIARSKANEARVKPVHELCAKAFEDIGRNPAGAADAGEKVLAAARPMINRLAAEGLDIASVHELEDSVAATVMQCAIAHANARNKWTPAISLLEKARGLAHGAELIQRIDENLATARRNHQFYSDLDPVTSAPSLWTVNGFGFTVYGNSDTDPATGSYMTTYYFVALFIPVFPIRRYRVISSGSSYRFLGRAPLRTFDKWHLAASIGLLLFWLFSLRH